MMRKNSRASTEHFTVTADLAPKVEDIAQVRAGLMAFNDAHGGPVHVQRVAVFLRDAQNAIRGGLVGFHAWDWLYVELLWVDDSLRGLGHGSALLTEAEQLARNAGCIAARLETYEFQARAFYEKHGYVVFGVLEGYPANTRTYYCRKTL